VDQRFVGSCQRERSASGDSTLLGKRFRYCCFYTLRHRCDCFFYLSLFLDIGVVSGTAGNSNLSTFRDNPPDGGKGALRCPLLPQAKEEAVRKEHSISCRPLQSCLLLSCTKTYRYSRPCCVDLCGSVQKQLGSSCPLPLL
jgi:hypothetical protein